MKKFNKFLIEINLSKTKREHSPSVSDNQPDESYKHVSTTHTGHHIYQNGNEGLIHFKAVNRQTGKPDIEVTGIHHEHKNGSKTLSHLSVFGRPGSELKAYDMYHHLITHHNYILHSDHTQTPGGMKVWKSLHKMPGIHVHGFHAGRGHRVDNIGLHHTHEYGKSGTENSRWGPPSVAKVKKKYSSGLKNLANQKLSMKLVAHKADE